MPSIRSSASPPSGGESSSTNPTVAAGSSSSTVSANPTNLRARATIGGTAASTTTGPRNANPPTTAATATVPAHAPASLGTLPPEALLIIARGLDGAGLRALASTNRYFHAVTLDERRLANVMTRMEGVGTPNEMRQMLSDQQGPYGTAISQLPLWAQVEALRALRSQVNELSAQFRQRAIVHIRDHVRDQLIPNALQNNQDPGALQRFQRELDASLMRLETSGKLLQQATGQPRCTEATADGYRSTLRSVAMYLDHTGRGSLTDLLELERDGHLDPITDMGVTEVLRSRAHTAFDSLRRSMLVATQQTAISIRRVIADVQTGARADGMPEADVLEHGANLRALAWHLSDTGSGLIAFTHTLRGATQGEVHDAFANLGLPPQNRARAEAAFNAFSTRLMASTLGVSQQIDDLLDRAEARATSAGTDAQAIAQHRSALRDLGLHLADTGRGTLADFLNGLRGGTNADVMAAFADLGLDTARRRAARASFKAMRPYLLPVS
jgi:hypothetical protein